MKQLYTILTAVLLTAGVLLPQQSSAQSPEKMSYQAVIRNSSDQLVSNQGVGMQISILQGSATGTEVYVETQAPTTNANGLVNIEIGGSNATVVSGDFFAIDWANDIYFIKTETDPTTAGGTTYTITGTSQLLSVPYALHAKTAESITGTITETDPIFGTSVANDITGADITSWNNKLDSYIETDPIFGTSIANGITGTDTTNWNNKLDSYTETDPVYTISQAANITATDITNLSNLSGANTGDQTISRIGLTVTLTNGNTYQDSVNTYAAGDGIEITGTTISEHKYQVGDFAQGGIVFWLDETGEHGLVCAKEDQDGGSGVRWYAGTSGNTQAKGDGPYAGEVNTVIIIAAQVAIGDDGNTYAARICNELQITEGGKTYGDWYLPSKQELNLMYQNKTTIDATATGNGGVAFAKDFYWSSTEYSHDTVWQQSLNYYNQRYQRKDYTYRVRAVRAF